MRDLGSELGETISRVTHQGSLVLLVLDVGNLQQDGLGRSAHLAHYAKPQACLWKST